MKKTSLLITIIVAALMLIACVDKKHTPAPTTTVVPTNTQAPTSVVEPTNTQAPTSVVEPTSTVAPTAIPTQSILPPVRQNVDYMIEKGRFQMLVQFEVFDLELDDAVKRIDKNSFLSYDVYEGGVDTNNYTDTKLDSLIITSSSVVLSDDWYEHLAWVREKM